MTISEEVEFNHLLNEFFGVGSPIYQYCIHYKIKFHRKLRAKLKEVVEYVDETGTTVKLSEEDIYEFNAIPSFKAYMQNGLGPKGPRLQLSLDITKYSREDFLRYLGGTYDPENPDKYDIKLASHSVLRRLSFIITAKIHGGITTIIDGNTR